MAQDTTKALSIYEKNLEALRVKDPRLYSDLLGVKTNTKFEVFLGSDNADFNIIDIDSKTPLFQTNSLSENLALYEDLKSYSYYPYLYFYGLGNGVLYRMLLGSTILKRLVIIEPELEIIYIVLNLIDLSSEIYTDRVILLLSKYCNYHMIASLFEIDKDSKIYSKVYDLLCPFRFYDTYKDELIDINHKFIKAIEHNVISVGNDTQDAIIGLKHHILNMLDVLSNPNLMELHNILKDRDTAIIVSTGPSLYKQLDTLKDIAPFATLFCIDASFPVLYKAGIKPDIVFTLERVKESAKFYKDTPKKAQEGVVFELTSIVHRDTIKAITNGTKQFSFRPFGYTSIFSFHEYGYLGIGMSAANMAYELVVHSRFKRCIIIGQDLAFGEDGTSHSKGAVYGESEIKPKPKKDRLMIEKYGGGGLVETTEVWKLFLNFYEKDIAQTPYNLEVINSTEGGARIKGTKEIPFKEAIKLIPRVKKDPIVLHYPDRDYTKTRLKEAMLQVEDLLSYGRRVKKDVEKTFLKLVKFLEKIEKLNSQDKLTLLVFDKMESISKDIDKIKETYNEVRFRDYFGDALQSYIFHQELDIAKILVKPITSEIEQKAKTLELLYAHKYWLFSLAGGIDSVLKVVSKALRSLKAKSKPLLSN
ncbi:6-hydroxymethylpterin diphosphokinase MptE-like protein [Helicobacter sp. 11S02629-2]|uniref:motility associated factor glycosyltransferase family protein n=1 Tax=Helicobacter sp. 11S02629-2 TaxID=1476195 RepID=UPI000BA76223|nr:6-hydroxymethylpterin diphosphokinase MptE-like protein [Helicobacter sp. 11S02629-2]PAF44101.1 motility accessory factor [Helicobacter sp. 11S02629-2]